LTQYTSVKLKAQEEKRKNYAYVTLGAYHCTMMWLRYSNSGRDTDSCFTTYNTLSPRRPENATLLG